MNQKDWVELWKSCLRIDYDPVLDVCSIGSEKQPTELITEVLNTVLKKVI